MTQLSVVFLKKHAFGIADNVQEQVVEKALALLITMTATGKDRERLTDANIFFMAAVAKLREIGS